MKEDWLDVPGYDEKYKVSRNGQIRSIDIMTNGRYGLKKQPGRILKQQLDKTGYMRVQLSLNGVIKHHLVHRVVASTFLKPVEGSNYVNHIDGVKHHNYLENLEWVTAKQNREHGIKTGLIKFKSGKEHPLYNRIYCRNGHEVTVDSTYVYKNKRTCRICAAENKRKRAGIDGGE